MSHDAVCGSKRGRALGQQWWVVRQQHAAVDSRLTEGHHRTRAAMRRSAVEVIRRSASQWLHHRVAAAAGYESPTLRMAL